jgi:hypothetical protein
MNEITTSRRNDEFPKGTADSVPSSQDLSGPSKRSAGLRAATCASTIAGAQSCLPPPAAAP